MNEEINELINSIPGIDTKMKYLIETADFLFKDKKIKISVNESATHKGKNLIRIYFNDSLCLWFIEKENNEYTYDGWEMGDYKDEAR